MTIGNNFSYFSNDNKCYSNTQNNDLSNNMDSSFNKYTYIIDTTNATDIRDPINACKEKAIEEQTKMFVVSDMEKATPRTFSYNCYIPNKEYLNSCSIDTFGDRFNTSVTQSLFKPFNDLLNHLFYNNSTTTSVNIDDQNDILHYGDKATLTDGPKCFRINNNESNINRAFGIKDNYVIYKTKLIPDNNRDRDSESLDIQIQNSYKEYRDTLYLGQSGNKDYYMSKKNEVFTSIADALQSLSLCNADITNTDSNEVRLYKRRLCEYINFRKKVSDSLSNIQTDLSNISLITSYDTIYLEELQELIDNQKIELKNLLGLDSGNNGKLQDTLDLKNLKLSENIILLLIITTVIFIYSKKLI
tara:strand:+ start:1210 stop:2286 length:1077 start_codon:yes stop_codon:yes gene_type:complete